MPDYQPGDAPIIYRAEPFPQALALHSYSLSLEWDISCQQCFVLRTMLEAAGMGEETATAQDLDDLGVRFRWLEYPGKRKSKRQWEWKELVSLPEWKELVSLPLYFFPCPQALMKSALPFTQVLDIVRRMPKRQKPYLAPTIVLEGMSDDEKYSDEDDSDGDEE
ncbi:hypothetical protein BCR35DRAFT_21332 [Leucosporidium creatinivorum]|uniref:Uncharacterized protein n=1 Tax=Leucosporidium creatinivorum TaxID=106004 RepID=A0A1Y2CUP2_9BASI|nr:hypothetical protein BCR35DRAFT_21332 [Leucosporidium creatinivorum]